MPSEAHSFLTSIATELRRENAAIIRMDSVLVERDIGGAKLRLAGAGLAFDREFEGNSNAWGSVKQVGVPGHSTVELKPTTGNGDNANGDVIESLQPLSDVTTSVILCALSDE